MKFYIFPALVLSFLTVTPSAFAQAVAVKELAPACTVLSGNLALGSIDHAPTNDVTHLQTFLASYGYLATTNVIGMYGPQTSAAVRAFQGAQGLPVAGNVGPLTREMIKNVSCGVTASAPEPSSALSLISYDMPELLSKGELGAWILQLPQNAASSTYTYSALWGDEGKNAPSEKNIDTKVHLSAESKIVFTHAYKKAGHYSEAFNVKNANGEKIRLLTNIDVK